MGIQNMIDVACPACGRYRAEKLFVRTDLTYRMTDDEYTVVRCRRCHFVYLNPQPTPDEIKALYPSSFYDSLATPEEILRKQEYQLELKWQYVKDLPTGKMLDVGCMKGEFAHYMSKRGWGVRGLEFSLRVPNSFQIEMFYGDLENAPYENESFDLITLWAVLEHMPNPRQVLEKVHHLLKPGGRLILCVPNFASFCGWFMRQDDIPRHLIFFTPETLVRMCYATGFDEMEIRFDHRLFGGTHRGILNFAFKLECGEALDKIVRDSRTNIECWSRFSTDVHGQYSREMDWVDCMDRLTHPYFDDLMDRLGMGYTMVASMLRPPLRDRTMPAPSAQSEEIGTNKITVSNLKMNAVNYLTRYNLPLSYGNPTRLETKEWLSELRDFAETTPETSIARRLFHHYFLISSGLELDLDASRKAVASLSSQVSQLHASCESSLENESQLREDCSRLIEVCSHNKTQHVQQAQELEQARDELRCGEEQRARQAQELEQARDELRCGEEQRARQAQEWNRRGMNCVVVRSREPARHRNWNKRGMNYID